MSLIELIVSLALLALTAAIAGLAWGVHDPTQPQEERYARIADARRRALEERKPVTIEVWAEDGLSTATAWPDGRVVADSALTIDHLTGRRKDAR